MFYSPACQNCSIMYAQPQGRQCDRVRIQSLTESEIGLVHRHLRSCWMQPSITRLFRELFYGNLLTFYKGDVANTARYQYEKNKRPSDFGFISSSKFHGDSWTHSVNASKHFSIHSSFTGFGRKPDAPASSHCT
jgi:hypothetical protein